MDKTLGKAALAGLLVVAYSQQGAAAGFAVLEQSAKRMGSAYAGAGAVADGAGSVWYNPASAPEVGQALEVGVHYIDPSFEFSDPVASDPVAAAPLLFNSRQTDDGGQSAVVANISYTGPLSEQWYAGVTLNVPFGLATDYRDDWVGRYQALESRIDSINLNPFIAYRFDDNWSAGFGINVNYTEVSLSRAIDFAAVCAGLVGGLCPNGAIPGSGSFDGEVETEGDDTGTGYNLGLLWSPGDDTRVSVAYRSEIDLDLEGDGDFSNPTALGGFTALGPVLGGGLNATFADSDIQADLTLPDTFSLALFQRLNPRTALLADVTWTGWSSVDEIRIDFENPLTPTAVEPLQWDDTMRYSLGLRYEPSDSWTVYTGVAYDESPVPNERLRSPRLPDNDRTWLAFGASKTLTPQASMDISYSHIFIDDTDIVWERPGGDLISGQYESTANNLSLSFNVRF